MGLMRKRKRLAWGPANSLGPLPPSLVSLESTSDEVHETVAETSVRGYLDPDIVKKHMRTDGLYCSRLSQPEGNNKCTSNIKSSVVYFPLGQSCLHKLLSSLRKSEEKESSTSLIRKITAKVWSLYGTGQISEEQ